MPAAPFIGAILGFRDGVANNADVANPPSRAIAAEMMRLIGVTQDEPPRFDAGRALEVGVRDHLAAALPVADPNRLWDVQRRLLITDFVQYEHLARVDALVQTNPTLRTELGRDYLIAPDVTVGVGMAAGSAVLHAAISCKWTIRSDRVQNIRHEGVILTRNRRGRQPHIVTVTAEPLPTRLAAIARGTGEVDGVYHVALDELTAAVNLAGSQEQRSVLAELVTQHRLFDYVELVNILTST